MYAEVRLKDGRVFRVPFVCRMCGRCCRELSKVVFDPVEGKVYMEDYDRIERYVDFREVVERLSRELEVSHPVVVRCPFLKGNVCEIHPIRPKSCRDFPFIEGFDQGIGCPGLKRLREIISVFEFVEVKYVTSDCDKPVEIDGDIFERFISLNPSEEELKKFLKLNRLSSRT